MNTRISRIAYLADCPEQVVTLAEWHHREWSHLNPGDTLDRRVERLRAHGRGGIPTTVAAFEEAKLLGSAALVDCDMHGREDLSPWLASVFVAPAHRGCGVGRRLVARIVEEAERAGVATLYLFTPDRERFYTHMGWCVHERTSYLGQEVVIMSLALGAEAGGDARCGRP